MTDLVRTTGVPDDDSRSDRALDIAAILSRIGWDTVAARGKGDTMIAAADARTSTAARSCADEATWRFEGG
jgi:hypothetical protein